MSPRWPVEADRRRLSSRCRLFYIVLLGCLLGLPMISSAALRLTDGLKITYDPPDARFVDRTVSVIRAVRPQLQANLGLATADTIHIHIAATQDEFQTYTPGAIPDWGAGYAVPSRRLIVLKSPRISGSFDNAYEVTVHELAHVMLHSALRGVDIPRWLDEGFAMYAAREWGFRDRAELFIAVITDNLIPLGAIGAVNTFSERKAQLAYQESALAVQYILRRYGRDGLHALLDRLRVTGSINQACNDAFGISAARFEQDWLDWLTYTYGWRMLPLEGFSLAIGPLFVILCILSYIQMRRRRRSVLRRWEQEEAADWTTAGDDEWRQRREAFTVVQEEDEWTSEGEDEWKKEP